MHKNDNPLTTSQFAKLHHVNTRTLHYYDTIGLFSPNEKGENGYRYYEMAQSMDFEYIRMLKELNMKIAEIKEYVKAPSPEAFIQIANQKLSDIESQMETLKHAEQVLQVMLEQAEFCINEIPDFMIQHYDEEELVILPNNIYDEDVSVLFSNIKKQWKIEQIRMGIGCYIAIDKVMKHETSTYDGLYSPALKHTSTKQKMIRPEGNYLCGFQKGSWDQLPRLYRNLLKYADSHQIKLTGYAYEMGINEFMMNHQEEYITQVMIKIADVD